MLIGEKALWRRRLRENFCYLPVHFRIYLCKIGQPLAQFFSNSKNPLHSHGKCEDEEDFSYRCCDYKGLKYTQALLLYCRKYKRNYVVPRRFRLNINNGKVILSYYRSQKSCYTNRNFTKSWLDGFMHLYFCKVLKHTRTHCHSPDGFAYLYFATFSN